MSINLPISDDATLASTLHGFDTVDLAVVKPDEAALVLAPGDFAVKHKVLPIRLDGETLVVAIGSPDALQAADDLGVLTGRPVLPVLADPQMIKDKIDEFFLARLLQGLAGEDESTTIEEISDLGDLTRMADDSQVVGMVNAIFAQAVRDRASDIHIEPYEREVKVRIRIDGMLHELMRPPKRLHNAIVSRLKILGEMNIAERRLPQDGRIKLNLGGRSIDVRVSIVPTGFGERAVMRILDKSTAMLSLEELGFGSDVLERYRKLITIPVRHHPRDRSDRRGQVHDALRLAPGDLLAAHEHPHHRGPGRVPGAGNLPNPGAGEHRPHFRERPPFVSPPRPRRHHGGRDPRPRDG